MSKRTYIDCVKDIANELERIKKFVEGQSSKITKLVHKRY